MDKKTLRKQFLELRLAGQWDEVQVKIIEHLRTYFTSRPTRCVGVYWPIKNEIDIRVVMMELCSQGLIECLALPRLDGKFMRFFLWDRDTLLCRSSIGLIEPQSREEVVPDLLLVPCVALDGEGRRLGYGGGYFDRFLTQYPNVETMGVLAQAFLVESLPHEPFDRKLDGWVTAVGLTEK